MSDRPRGAVLAIDPGREKHGLAVVAPDGACLARAILATEALLPRVQTEAERHGPLRLILGNGTGHRPVLDLLTAAGFHPELVPEHDTTRRARARYFADHPPKGWRRLIPRGLLVPPVLVDDFAALLLAEAALAADTSQRR